MHRIFYLLSLVPRFYFLFCYTKDNLYDNEICVFSIYFHIFNYTEALILCSLNQEVEDTRYLGQRKCSPEIFLHWVVTNWNCSTSSINVFVWRMCLFSCELYVALNNLYLCGWKFYIIDTHTIVSFTIYFCIHYKGWDKKDI